MQPRIIERVIKVVGIYPENEKSNYTISQQIESLTRTRMGNRSNKNGIIYPQWGFYPTSRILYIHTLTWQFNDATDFSMTRLNITKKL